MRCFSSSLKIWTMCRSDWESANLKTYLPGSSTFLGTCIGASMVMMVFLFQASALACGTSPPTISTAQETEANTVARLFIVFLLGSLNFEIDSIGDAIAIGVSASTLVGMQIWRHMYLFPWFQ